MKRGSVKKWLAGILAGVLVLEGAGGLSPAVWAVENDSTQESVEESATDEVKDAEDRGDDTEGNASEKDVKNAENADEEPAEGGENASEQSAGGGRGYNGQFCGRCCR